MKLLKQIKGNEGYEKQNFRTPSSISIFRWMIGCEKYFMNCQEQTTKKAYTFYKENSCRYGATNVSLK